MHYDISFPHLGITLDHVGKSVDLFGVSIAYYGIIIGMAILIGFAIATSEAKRTRQNPEDYLDMGIIGVIAGIAGARIYYVIFSWDMYKDDLLDIFNLREGGLAIYGSIPSRTTGVTKLAIRSSPRSSGSPQAMKPCRRSLSVPNRKSRTGNWQT